MTAGFIFTYLTEAKWVKSVLKTIFKIMAVKNTNKSWDTFLENTNTFRDLYFGILLVPLNNCQREKYSFEICLILITGILLLCLVL